MTKYAAISLTVLALVAMIWGAVVYTRSVSAAAHSVVPLAAVTAPAKAGEDAMRHVRALDQMLTQVDDAMRMSPSTLAMAPLAASPKVAATATPVVAHSAVARGPVVTLVYLSPTFQRVVIDGSVLAIGDMVPGAGRIVAIDTDAITFVRGKQRYKLAVPKGPALGSVSAPVIAKAAR